MILGQSITKDNLFSLTWLVSKSFIAAFLQKKKWNPDFLFQVLSYISADFTETLHNIIMIYWQSQFNSIIQISSLPLAPLAFLVWHTSVPTSQRWPVTTVFICFCALRFYLPRILTDQWCVTSAVLNVGKMRSKQPNEYPRVVVKGKNQTHMNQSSGKKIRLPSLPSFHVHHKFPRKVFIEEISNYLCSTSFFLASIWNIRRRTMYFALIKLKQCILLYAKNWLPAVLQGSLGFSTNRLSFPLGLLSKNTNLVL